jgi:hypothetical protein
MIRRTLSTASVFWITLFAAPAVAQSVEKDVRCMMVSQAFSRLEKDPAKKQLAAASALYYFGRVDAQVSGSALRNQFIAQNSVIKQQNGGEIMTGCAKDFNAHQQALQLSVQGAVKAAPPAKK